jgi:hypothetical protein
LGAAAPIFSKKQIEKISAGSGLEKSWHDPCIGKDRASFPIQALTLSCQCFTAKPKPTCGSFASIFTNRG